MTIVMTQEEVETALTDHLKGLFPSLSGCRIRILDDGSELNHNDYQIDCVGELE